MKATSTPVVDISGILVIPLLPPTSMFDPESDVVESAINGGLVVAGIGVVETGSREDVASPLNSVEFGVSVETSDDATSESGRILSMINRIQPLPHDNTWRPLQQVAAICREYLQRWNNNLQVVKVGLAYLMKTFSGLDPTMSIG